MKGVKEKPVKADNPNHKEDFLKVLSKAVHRYYEPVLYQSQVNRQQEISDELLRTLKASEHYGFPRVTEEKKKHN